MITMREYRLPGGELIPADLQEKIAEDVRAFDAAQTPDARSAMALRKISNELPRIRAVMSGCDEQSATGRQTVALEIQTLLDLGYSVERVRQCRRARILIMMYGLTEDDVL